MDELLTLNIKNAKFICSCDINMTLINRAYVMTITYAADPKKRCAEMSVVTVTTTTVAVAISRVGIAAALGATGTCILISALIAKELVSSYEDSEPLVRERRKLLTRGLNIVIIPMLLIFALIVALKVMEVF